MKIQTSLIALALLVGCADADNDGDGFGATIDCDDDDPAIHPGANEFCDGVDNDCNDVVDDPYATDGVVFFIDEDGDGFGTAADSAVACADAAPEGFVPDATDCDDEDERVYPTAPELCNLIDDNCNGSVDDDPEDAPIWYADYDQDGFGSRTLVTKACEGPTGWIKVGDDCNDFDFYVNPNALEYCDNIDNDCDDTVDEPDAEDHSVFYEDRDGDGYGWEDSPIDACWLPDGYSESPEDCNDDPAMGGAAQVPYTEEICKDGLDNNCNNDGDQCWYTSWVTPESATLKVKGSGSSAYLGYDINSAGDVDDDGYDDFILGAYRASIETSYAGAGFLVYGGPDGTFTESSVKMTDLPHFYSEGSYDYLGRAVSGLGDIDGDGYDDVGIGAYSMDDGPDGSYRSSSGSLVIIYGDNTQYEEGYNVEDEDNAIPMIFGDKSSAYLGSSVASAGDLNGDGISEFMTGGYYRQNSDGDYGAGAVWVFPGASGRYSGRTESSSVGAIFVGADRYHYLGYLGPTIDSGDINADGRSDIVMGAYGADSYAGAIYLFYGDGTGFTGEIVAQDSMDVKWGGTASYAYLGRVNQILGDINDDGYDDLFIGDYRAQGSAGAVYVIFGDTGRLSGGDPASKADVTINGPSGSAYLGYGRSTIADLDGDDVPELIVGAYRANTNGANYNGGAYVFEGGSDFGTVSSLDTSGGAADATLGGDPVSYMYFGYQLASGDRNGDGYDDLAVAAYGDLGYAGSVLIYDGTDW